VRLLCVYCAHEDLKQQPCPCSGQKQVTYMLKKARGIVLALPWRRRGAMYLAPFWRHATFLDSFDSHAHLNPASGDQRLLCALMCVLSMRVRACACLRVPVHACACMCMPVHACACTVHACACTLRANERTVQHLCTYCATYCASTAHLLVCTTVHYCELLCDYCATPVTPYTTSPRLAV
jgi:hypothetical protein